MEKVGFRAGDCRPFDFSLSCVLTRARLDSVDDGLNSAAISLFRDFPLVGL